MDVGPRQCLAARGEDLELGVAVEWESVVPAHTLTCLRGNTAVQVRVPSPPCVFHLITRLLDQCHRPGSAQEDWDFG